MPEALYRKYRPQVFEDVVGQESIVHTLKNALEQNKVSHAYLFTGSRGTGKTTMARLLAKALLCQAGPTATPDGTCEDCLMIAEGTHPDVYELDAASRTGVDSVRDEIISRVGYAPTRGTYKVYIIDEVHMLSTAAFNALLKTLEEPPSHVVFVLCTTDPQKVPETIHSRCQRFDFRRIAPEAMVTRLGAICVAEGVEFEGEALDVIAQRAEGGLRNALTSLEQIITYEGGKVTRGGAERLLGSIDSNDLSEIMAFIGTGDAAACFRWVAAYVETGADLAQFASDMAEHARNLYLLALAGDDAALDVDETARLALANELQWFGVERASRMLNVLGDLMAELRVTSNPRLAFEIALTRLVRPESDLTVEALAQRVERLECAQVAPSTGMQGKSGAQGVQDVQRAQSAQRAPIDAAATDRQQVTPEITPEIAPEITPKAAPRVAVAATSEATSKAEASVSAQKRHEATVDEPSAAVTSSAQVPAAFANTAAVQRTWQQVLADVKRVKQAYSALFLNVKAAYDDATSTLHIVFPAQATFAFQAVQKPEARSVLAAALEKVVKQPVEFVLSIAEDGTPIDSEMAVEKEQTAQVTQTTQTAQTAQAKTAQTTQAAQAQAAQPQVPEEPDLIDEVPLDVYEQEAGFVSAVAAEPKPSSAAGKGATSAGISDKASFASPASDASSTADSSSNSDTVSASNTAASAASNSSAASDVADFNAVLQLGFGDDVSFEEVS